MIHEISGKKTKNEWNLLTYTGQTDTVTDQISQEVIEHTSHSGLQTKVVFFGGEKSVYCNVYQRLQADYDYECPLITETEIKATTILPLTIG